MVVSTAGGLQLSRKLARGAATDRQLEDAFRTGLPVEGRVEKAVKGGYEVRIGRQRGFCPFSQIDTLRTDPATHEGKVYAFRIIEYKDGGKDLVVSRRALLEEEQRASAAEVRKSIVAGAVITGAWRRYASSARSSTWAAASRACSTFRRCRGREWPTRRSWSNRATRSPSRSWRSTNARHKISLGLKQLAADPWSTISQTYAIGDVRTGRVTRVADFGAFVELEPGIEALAHASTFPPTGRSEGWSRQVAPGTTGAFEILTIDPEKKRMGVALLPEGSARAGGAAPSRPEIVAGARVTGKVERHEKFGVFVFLAPGRTGLIPMSETGVAREADVARTFPVGADIEVVVLEADPSSRRIRLSAKAVNDAREAAEVREYTERENAAPTGSFGSLADKLRGALKPR